MEIAVSGSTGLVGTALVEELLQAGHVVSRLVRPDSAPKKNGIPIPWNPATGEIGLVRPSLDAVVNLAGASIGEGRWTAQRKAALRSSRVNATRRLVEAVGRLNPPPRTLVSATAVGYYGNRGDEILTEESAQGNDFLATLAADWEAEARKAEAFGTRVVLLRFGVILARHGGALPRMMLPIELMVGGRLGSGKQWMPWLTLREAAGIARFALENDQLRGPVNAVAPQPVTNAEFTRVLAKALHRPALFPAPAFALRLALGEMADALLLGSQRVVPQKLLQSGYKFAQPELPGALAAVLAAG